jgi:inosine-uridine nucleoside N-ribohydrolase
MIYIDSDNAMGAPGGNVDDGFAVAALLRSGVEIAALASVKGNTFEHWADRNNSVIAAICGWKGRSVRGQRKRKHHGNPAADFLVSNSRPLRIVALGPLSNVGAALERSEIVAAEIVVVGGNASSRGRWPPLWPHELNLTADRPATRAVFGSSIPITVLPIDIGRRMKIRREQLDAIDGLLGEYIRSETARWFRRMFWTRFSREISVTDLPAAMYVIDPSLFVTDELPVTLHQNCWLEFGRGERRVKAIRSFDPDTLWQRFLEIVNRRSSSGGAFEISPG